MIDKIMKAKLKEAVLIEKEKDKLINKNNTPVYYIVDENYNIIDKIYEGDEITISVTIRK